MGRYPMVTIGFGSDSEWSRSRRPCPPQNKTTFTLPEPLRRWGHARPAELYGSGGCPGRCDRMVRRRTRQCASCGPPSLGDPMPEVPSGRVPASILPDLTGPRTWRRDTSADCDPRRRRGKPAVRRDGLEAQADGRDRRRPNPVAHPQALRPLRAQRVHRRARLPGGGGQAVLHPVRGPDWRDHGQHASGDPRPCRRGPRGLDGRTSWTPDSRPAREAACAGSPTSSMGRS